MTVGASDDPKDVTVLTSLSRSMLHCSWTEGLPPREVSWLSVATEKWVSKVDRRIEPISHALESSFAVGKLSSATEF